MEVGSQRAMFTIRLQILTKSTFADDIKEEEMEITLEYDNDDFTNDPSFTITSILDDKELAEHELNDIFADADADADDDDDIDSDSELDESENSPRKRRRKTQVPDNKTYK